MASFASIEKTETLHGIEDTTKAVIQVRANAQSKLDICASSAVVPLTLAFEEKASVRGIGFSDLAKKGVQVRYIAEITPQNIQHCKKLSELIEVRHIDQMKNNMGVSDTEYILVIDFDNMAGFTKALYSNIKELAEHQRYLFEALWSKAIPAEQRIREIEEGKTAGRTEVIYGHERILEALNLFIEKIEFEARIMAPQPAAIEYLEMMKIFERLIPQKINRNISIKLVGSLGEANRLAIRRVSPFVQYKSVEPTAMSSIVFVSDNKEVFLMSIKTNPNKPVIDTLMRSNDRFIVEAIISTFEAWWRQVENYDSMMEEKTHAELLLDLITHDMGNHNQIIAPNLELAQAILEAKALAANLSQNDFEDLCQHIGDAEKAHKRSVSLVDNIRRLERMYREKEAALGAHDLVSAIGSALATVRNSGRMRKEILFSLNFNGKDTPYVLADDLLEEVFVNLFFNVVNATDDAQARIDVDIQPYAIGPVKYWMITVSDYGHGIPDEKKSELFARFYSKAKGTGLGLSIVRALVERYKGKVWAGDRVYKDHTKGAKFGIILHQASKN